jgi:hypothetical protein
VRLAFHLGPEVEGTLDGATAELSWPAGTARLELPGQLSWSLHRGQTEPILGWYSHGLGRRTPAVTLLGAGRCEEQTPLETRLKFQ